jgi:hypothetical protein
MLVATRKKMMRRELMIPAAIILSSAGLVTIAVFARGWSEISPADYQYIQRISEDKRTSQITYNLMLDCFRDNKISRWEYDSIHESFMSDKKHHMQNNIQDNIQSNIESKYRF